MHLAPPYPRTPSQGRVVDIPGSLLSTQCADCSVCIIAHVNQKKSVLSVRTSDLRMLLAMAWVSCTDVSCVVCVILVSTCYSLLSGSISSRLFGRNHEYPAGYRDLIKRYQQIYKKTSKHIKISKSTNHKRNCMCDSDLFIDNGHISFKPKQTSTYDFRCFC